MSSNSEGSSSQTVNGWKTTQDPLFHHGCHFGQAVHAFCNVPMLLTNGIIFLSFFSERKEFVAFWELLQVVPGLEEEVVKIGKLIQKGMNWAHADDTKGMKGAITNWITPKGQSLSLHIPCNVKLGRGFNYEHTGALLCPAGLDWTNIQTRTKLMNGEIQVPGDQWSVFLYAGYTYDLEDPWNGLLHSSLLVSAYKHVFTSPSSVDQEPKATCSGNVDIHGMHCVTKASIMYVAIRQIFPLYTATE
ncbi:hypothetical protein EDC04DRAFT_2866071 [Pisolithus marmoratus]|nr:hypothetical protein EDC04DRAFT_2866071 [Pisolithus marmoratus]